MEFIDELIDCEAAKSESVPSRLAMQMWVVH